MRLTVRQHHKEDNGVKLEKHEILKRVMFARAVCVDVGKPRDVAEITEQLCAAKLPIDDDVGLDTHLRLIWPTKLDKRCRLDTARRLVTRINSSIRRRTPPNFTWSSLTMRFFRSYDPPDRSAQFGCGRPGVLILFGEFDQCAVDAGGGKVVCRPDPVDHVA